MLFDRHGDLKPGFASHRLTAASGLTSPCRSNLGFPWLRRPEMPMQSACSVKKQLHYEPRLEMAEMIGLPIDNGIGVSKAQAGLAIVGSNRLPVFSTPKHRTSSLRMAATTICLGLRRPAILRRTTRAAIAGLNRIADSAGM